MARIAFGHMDEAGDTVPAQDAGMIAMGQVDTRPVIRGNDRPVWLWMHQLAPGVSVAWEDADAGHCLYLWNGSLEASGTPLVSGDTVFVERGGDAQLKAGPDGATLLDFHDARQADGSERAGGHAHVIPAQGDVRADERYREVYLDSTCSTCELWLHKTNFPTLLNADLHYHTADEIIVVARGEMRLGRRTLTVGGAIAIDAGTQYGFSSGDEGICLINFRPAQASVVMMDENGAWKLPLLETRDMELPSKSKGGAAHSPG